MVVKKSENQNRNEIKKISEEEGATFDLSQLGDALLPSESRMAVEPRVLLDAASTETADAVVDTVAAQQASDWAAAQTDSSADSSFDFDAGPTASEVETTETNDIYFIDGSLDDIEDLTSEIPPTSQIVILDTESDGMEQIAAYLEGKSDVDSVHIISHGSEGELALGNATLNADTMRGEHQDELTAIKSVLTDEADILIYGCDFTGGAEGLEAAILLGSITGADIAASDDVTGNADLGGDWDLETSLGSVEADSLVADQWDGTLAVPLDTDGDGIDDIDDVDDDNDGISDEDEVAEVLDGLTAATAFTELGMAQSVDTAGDYYFNLDGNAFNTHVDENGYVRVAVDHAGGEGDLPQGTDLSATTLTTGYTATTHRGILDVTTLGALIDITEIRFSHSGGDLDATTTNAELIDRVQNNESLLSAKADSVYNTEWTGTGANRLNVGGSASSVNGTDLDSNIFHPSGNTGGFSWVPAADNQRVYWSGGEIATGETLSLWVRADAVDAVVGVDTDGDGIDNHLDLDSDNDGISDLVESGASAALIGLDVNNDGTISLSEADPATYSTVATVSDTDGDSVADYIDLDSDGDGIADTIEARATAGYAANDGDVTNNDADGDGIIDTFDSNDGTTGDFGGTHTNLNAPVDSDGDGTADYLDTDSDDDTILDKRESGLTLSGLDANGDGIDDATNASYADPDGDVNTTAADLANEIGDTSEVAFREITDTDGDSVVDAVDLDDDNDGILDTDEGVVVFDGLTAATAFTELGMAQSVDTAGDYYFNLDGNAFNTHVDENGYVRVAVDHAGGEGDLPQGTDLSATTLTTGYTATTHRGILDVTTLGALTDITEIRFSHSGGDLDATTTNAELIDRVQNNESLLSLQSDSVYNTEWTGTGANRLNVGGSTSSINGTDLDSNIFHPSGNTAGFSWVPAADNQRVHWNAGEIATGETLSLWVRADAVENVVSVDTDGDGIDNHLDLDSDNDGISDLVESGASAALIGLDANNDGTISLSEADPATYSPVAAVSDTDGDSVADYIDLDSDNDGISDLVESGASAALIGLDANNDGTISLSEADPATYSTVAAVSDTDSDGVADYIDLDSDGDGIADTIEARATAGYVANDGDVTNNDADGDGIIDTFDSNDGTTGDFGGTHTNLNAPVDSDGDGTADYLDTDSDDDAILDKRESGLTPSNLDANGDGIDDARNASYADPDGDVSATAADLANEIGDTSEVAFREITDTDGDSVADAADLDDDNDGILDIDEGSNLLLDMGSFHNLFADAGETVSQTLPQPGASTDVTLTLNSTGDGSVRAQDSGGSFGSLDPSGDESTLVFGGTVTANDEASAQFDFDTPVANVSFAFADLDGGSGTGTGTEQLTIEASYNGVVYTLQPGDIEVLAGSGPTQSGNVLGFGGNNNVFQINISGPFDSIKVISSGDGGSVLQRVSMFNMTYDVDTDGDGVADRQDIDSDNDGISDLAESGASAAQIALDANNDGSVSGADVDGDGLVDLFDADTADTSATASIGSVPVDSDRDGIANFLDLDSDNDGNSDLAESGASAAQIALDANNDGKISAAEADPATYSTIVEPRDSDGDGVADYLDLDSDNDGIVDLIEGGASAAQIAADTNKDGSITAIEADSVYDGLGDGDHDADGIVDVFDGVYNVQGYVFGQNATLDVGHFNNLSPKTVTISDNAQDIVFYDDDGLLDGDVGQVEHIKGTGTVLIDGEEFSYSADFFLEFKDDSTPSNFYTFIVVDVDLDHDGNLQTPTHSEDGVILIPIGAAPPASATLTYVQSVSGEPEGMVISTLTGASEKGAINTLTDTDGDGVANQLDLDSDNDGISDLVESGASAALVNADTNNDGTISVAESDQANNNATDGDGDAGGDGLMDVFEDVHRVQGYVIDDNVTLDDGNFYSANSASVTVSDTKEIVFYDHDSLLDGDTGENDYFIDTGTVIIDGQEYSYFADFVQNFVDKNDATKTYSFVVIDVDLNSSGSTSMDEHGKILVPLGDVPPPSTQLEATDIYSTTPETMDISTLNGYVAPSISGVSDAPRDTDGDGVADYHDLDSDGDGIADTIEARPITGFVTNDGDVTDNDADADGIIDQFDSNDNTTGDFGGDHSNLNAPVDSDGDGTADFRDTDSDGDGILDNVEIGQTLSGVDANGDGIDDATGVTYANPVNSSLYGPGSGSNGTVNENDLTIGTNGISVLGIADGLKELSVGGTVISPAQLAAATVAAPITVASTNGNLTITNFNAATGAMSYTFTLTTGADHSGAGNATEDVAIILTDDNDDTVSATLSFAVIDAGPSAENDTDEVVNVAGEVSSVAYGNVVTGIESAGSTDPNATDGTADAVGADVNANPVTGVAAGSGTPDATKVGGSGIDGTYGTLVISADGSYSYTPDYANTDVSGLSGSDTKTDTFTYQITDGDGDTATATLTINLYAAPEISDLTDGTEAGTDASVSESDLATGSDASGTNEAVSGAFTIGTVKALDKITVGGTDITAAALTASGTTAIDISTTNGTVSINGYDAASGAVSYTYTLTGAVDSSAVVTEDIAVSITDDLGDTATANLKIAIIDDVASAAADGDGVTEDAAAPIAGSVITNDTIGADTNAAPVTGVIAGTVGTPTGNVNTAVTGSYGSLTLEADGDYSYSLDNTNSAVQALALGATVTDVFTYQIADSDGDTATETLTITVTGANDGPVAVDDTATVNADATVGGNVLTGAGADTDIDGGDTLSVTQINGAAYTPASVITLASGATLTMATDGTFSYDPNGAFDGLGSTQADSDSFTYQVSDGNGGFDTATATITINGVDGDLTVTDVTGGSVSDAAVTTAATGSFTIDAEDGLKDLKVGSVTITPTALAAATVAAPVTVSGTHGDLSITGYNATSGAVSYSYTLNGVVDHTSGPIAEDFAITLSDEDSQTVSATLSFAIVDSAPSAADDTDEVVNVAGEVSSVAYGNVVTGIESAGSTDPNATDGTADAVGADVTANPVTGVAAGSGTPDATKVGGSGVAGTYGTLVISADGSYSYTPDYANTDVSGLSGSDTKTDTFTYQITDGDGDTATATLTINLYAAPEISDLTDGTETGTDASVSESDLATGSDASGTNEAVSGAFTIGTVKALDKITVGGTDITAAALTASGTTAIDISTSNGTVSINGYDAASGAVSYTYTLTGAVDSSAVVTEDIAVSITDDLGDTATANLKIAIIDDVASAAADGDGVTEDAAAPIAGSVITNDTIGADTNAAPVTGVIAGTVGTPTGNVNTAVTGSYGSLTLEADGDYSYSLDNTNSAVQALALGATVTDVFTYQIADSDGDTATETLTITVTGANDGPVAVDDTATVNADATVGGNVLTGAGADTDIDGGDTLSVTQINGAAYTPASVITLASGATLTMATDGTFSYDPNGAFDGLGSTQADSDSFTYQVSDGNGGFDTATATITINGVDGDLTVTDVTGGSVSDAAVTTAATGSFTIDAEDGLKDLKVGSVTITPTALAAATVAAPVTVSGTHGDLSITGYNATSGAVSYSYTLNGVVDHTSGPIAEDFAITLSDEDSQTVSATLSFAIVDSAPNAENDTDEVVNVAGEVSSVAYGNVVTGIESAGSTDPNATDGTADAVGADVTANPVTGVAAGSGTPDATKVGGSGVNGTYGTLVISADGSYSYTPDYSNTDVSGLSGSDTKTDTFTYQITDGDGSTSTATLTINLYAAPEISDLTDGTEAGTDASVSESDLATGSDASGTNEAVSGAFTIGTVKALDKITVGGTDITAAALTASGTTAIDISTTNGTVSINGYDAASGAVSYTYTLTGAVDSSAVVTEDIAVSITDDLGDTATANLKIAIIDDVASAAADGDGVTEDAAAPIAGSVITNDTIGADTNAAPVTGVIAGTVGTPTGNVNTAVTGSYGSLTLEADGDYSYSLDNTNSAVQALALGATVTDVFTYQIADSDGDTATETLTITVTGANDGPVAVDDTATVNADATVGGNVLTGAGADTDIDGGDTLSVTQINGAAYTPASVITLASGATLTMATDGTFSYDPNGAFDGLGSTQADSDSFTYQVSDGNGGFDTATATITINGVDGDLTVTDVTGGSVSDAAVTTAATGSFTIDAEDGLKDLKVGSVTITPTALAAATVAAPVTVSGTHGDLSITGYNATSGAVSYSYTLNGVVDHTSGPIAEDFAITLSDEDSQTVSATLSFAIVDSAPSAADDTDEVVNVAGEVSSVAYGNVVTGIESAGSTDPNATDGTADAVGADVTANPVTGVAAGSGTPDATKVGGSGVAGTYGTLVISADGSYSYTPDYANTDVSGLSGSDTKTDTFTYQITDGDGDTATATLTINLYAAPEISDLTDGTETGTDASVSESDLATGSDASGTNEAVSGAFTIGTVKALDKITVGGTDITAAALTASGTTAIDISTTNGTVSINGYDAASGAVSYTYTLTGAVDSSAVVTEDIAVSITDDLGDTATANLKIAIIDDVASAVADHDEVVNIAGQPSSVAYGNVLTAANAGDGGNTDVNTTDGVADTVGADANANPITAVGFGETPPTGGVGSTIVGANGSLVLNSDGSYSYTPDYSNTAVAALGPNETLVDVFTYELSDGDNSKSTTTLAMEIFGTPAINGITDGEVIGTDGVVLESDLSDGSNAAGTGEVLEGSFMVNTTNNTDKALDKITVEGTDILAADLATSGTTSISIATTYGSIEINGFEPSTGAVSYTYTLSSAADHSNGEMTENISMSITDKLGDVGSTTLKIVITDDVASATEDDNAVSEGATVSTVSGNVTDNDTIGADTDPADTPVIGVVAGTGTPVAASVGSAIDGTYGSLTLSSDGEYTYTVDNSKPVTQALNVGDTVSDVFTYEITDADGDKATQTLTIDVSGANSRPIAIDPNTGNPYPGAVDAATGLPKDATSGDVIQPIGPKTVVDNHEITDINVGAVVADPDSADTLTFAASGLPTGLSIDTATGIISGTVDASASTGGPSLDGVYPATVTATDVAGAAITLSITFTSDNTAPVAADNAYTSNEDVTGVSIGNALTDVDATSGTDSDEDGDALTVVAQTNAAGSNGGLFAVTTAGNLTFNANGDFDSLAVGETATTTLNYTIADGKGGTDTATVTVTVEGRNDAPVAINPDTGEAYTNVVDPATGLPIDPVTNEVIQPIGAQTGEDNGVITAINVAAVLTDVDTTDTLTYSATGLPTGLSIDATTGIISGTLDNSASQGGTGGVYTVNVTASDGEGGSIKPSFTMTVTNPGPTAVNDAFTASEDAVAVVVGNALTSDSDVDGDDIAAIPQTDVAGSNGGLFSIDAAGQVTFSGNNDFEALKVGETATTTLTYTVSDGEGGTADATVTVTVEGAYDRPYIIDPNTGKPYTGTVDPTTGLPTDPSGDLIQPIDAQTSVDNAVTSIDVGSHLPADLSYSATGLPVGLTIDATTGVISGTIDNSASQGGTNGVYTVTVTASDDAGGSITPSFTMTVTNPGPTAVNDAFTASEDAVAAVVGNALTSDSDVDGDDLTVTAQTDVAGSNGGLFSIDAAGQVTFSGNNDFEALKVGETATTTLTYTVSDGEGGTADATVTVTVEGAYDRPYIIDPNTGKPYTGTVDPTTGLPTDPSGDLIQPITAQTGVDNGAINSIDVGSHLPADLSYSATGLPVGLTIDATTGVISGTIDNSASQGGDNGVYTVTVTASDGEGGSITPSFTMTVTNPGPTAVNDAFTASEDAVAVVVGNALTSDSDVDGDDLTVTAQTDVAGSNGGLFSIDAAGQVTFSGNNDFEALKVGENATTTLTYTVSDGEGGTADATVTVTVEGAYDRPYIIDPDTGKPYTGTVDPTTGLPTDPSGNLIQPIDAQTGVDNGAINSIDVGSHLPADLSYSATGLPVGLTIDATTGVISGTIDNSASQGGTGGVYTVTVTASDDAGGSITPSFTMTVTNPGPTAVNDAFTASEDAVAAVVGNALTSDSDVDGDDLTVTAQTDAAGSNGGLFSIDAAGQVTFSGNNDFEALKVGESATTTLTYTVSDGEGGTADATVTVTVEGAYDRPYIIDPDTGKPYTGTVDPTTGLPTDPSGDLIQPITAQTGVDNGAINSIDVGSHLPADLSYSATSLPVGLTIDATTGVISGTIDNSASQGGTNGVYTVNVTASDGEGGSITPSFTMTVTNPGPTAVNDAFAASEDAVDAVVGNALTSDSDVDGDDLAVIPQTDVAGSNGGLFSIDADGRVTFSNNDDFGSLGAGDSTTTSLNYTVSDGEGGTDTATITVTVGGQLDRPPLIDPTTNEPYTGPFDPTTGLPIDSATGNVIQPIGEQTGEAGETDPIDVGAMFGGEEGLEYAATGLPAGLTIDPETGVISGEIGPDAHDGGPNQDGKYTATVTVTNEEGASTTMTFEYEVEPVSPILINPVTGQPYPGPFDPTTGLPIDPVTDEVIQPIGEQTGESGEVTPIDTGALFGGEEGLGFTATGLPAGLTIDPETGVISGEISTDAHEGGPNEDGNYVVTVEVTSAEGATTTMTFEYEVEPKLPTLIDPTTGQPYTGTIDPATGLPIDPLTGEVIQPIGPQTGESGEVTPIDTGALFGGEEGLGFTATGLPAGLTIDPETGVISGEISTDAHEGGPNEDGNYVVTVEVTSAEGATTTMTFEYEVEPKLPTLIDPTTGQPYTGTIDPATGLPIDPLTGEVIQPIGPQTGESGEVTPIDTGALFGGEEGLGFTATGLPAGLTIDPETGVISGEISTDAHEGGPNEDGNYVVTVEVTSAEGATTTMTFEYEVEPKLPTLIDPATGQPYTGTIDPATGLPIDPVTGEVIQPIGPQTGESGEVTPIDTGAPFGGEEGLGFTATGLPAGLTIDPETGVISGEISTDAHEGGPNEDGNYVVTVEVTSAEGATTTMTFEYEVEPKLPTLIDPATGQPYTGTIDPATGLPIDPVTGEVIQPIGPQTGESGEVTPIDTGALFGGEEGLGFTATGLPAGLTIDPETGVISGEISTDAHEGGPNEDGNYVVTVEVTSAEGATTTMTFEYEVEPKLPTLIDPTTGEPYTGTIDPATGLPIDPLTGEVIQPIGPQTGESGEVTPIDTGALFGGEEGLGFTATGLPAGLTIDPETGVISGEISTDAHDGGPNGDGTYVVTVEVTSAEGATTTMTFEYEVEPKLPTLIDPTTGEPYTGTIDPATGLPIDPLTGEVIQPIGPQTGESGEVTPIDTGALFGGEEGLGFTATGLPAGLTIDPETGVISGEISTDAHEGGPNEDGNYVVTVEVTSAEGATTTMTFEYEVEPKLPTLIDPTTGEPYTGTIDPATGLPIDPLTGEVIQPIGPQTGESGEVTPIDTGALFGGEEGLGFTATGLPAGLTIDPETGVISGEISTDAHEGGPNEDGNYVVTVEVTSAEGATTTMTFEYEVEPKLPTLIDPTTGQPYTGTIDPATGLPIDPLTGEVIQPIGPQTGESGEVTPIDTGALFGGEEGLGFTATGLPAGLTIDPETGVISGEISTDAHEGGPNEDGNYVVTVEVTSAEGATTTMTFEYEVEPKLPTLIDPATGQPYTGTIDPATGLPIDPLTGQVIQPIGPQTGESGEVTPIDTGALFGGEEGLGFTATGLPAGLTIDPETGVISGEISTDAHEGGPNEDGNYVVTVEVTSAEGATTTMTFEYGVEAQSPTLINPATGQPYTGPIDPATGLPIDPATGEVIQPIGPQTGLTGSTSQIDVGSLFGGQEGLEFEVSGLPAGLSIDPVTGIISGTADPYAYKGGPNGDGTYVVTVQVTSAEGVTTTITFEFEIDEKQSVIAPSIATPDLVQQTQEATDVAQEAIKETRSLIGDVDSTQNTYTLDPADTPITAALVQISPLNAVPWIDPDGNVVSQTVQWIDNTMQALDSSEAQSSGLLDNFDYVGGDISISTHTSQSFELRTMVHENRLYVEAVGSDQPVQLLVESMDAQASPKWVESVSSNLQMINPPIGKEEVSVVLVIKQENGESIKINARINLVRGGIEIEETIDSSAIQGLSEQLQTMNDEPVNKVRNLLKET